MSQALTPTGSTAIKKYGDEEQIKFEMRAMRSTLPGASVMNWRKPNEYAVSDELLRGLIIASKFSGLNPYRGEIYAVPEIGVTVASKIKAADAQAAAQKRGDHLTIWYESVFEGMDAWERNKEEFSLRPGDTVRMVFIRSNKAMQSYWEQRRARLEELRILYPGVEHSPQIDAQLRQEFPTPPTFTAIGVVKGNERDGNEKKLQENKFVAFTRSDRADKRALQRCLNLHGLAAADTRSYGDVPMADDSIEGEYRIMPSQPVQQDDAWAAVMREAAEKGLTNQPPPEDKTAPTTPEQHQRQQEVMRGKPDADPDAPFGESPKKDAPKPTQEQRQEFAKLVGQVKAIGQEPCIPKGVASAAEMQDCIDQMKTKLAEFEKAGTPQ